MRLRKRNSPKVFTGSLSTPADVEAVMDMTEIAPVIAEKDIAAKVTMEIADADATDIDAGADSSSHIELEHGGIPEGLPSSPS